MATYISRILLGLTIPSFLGFLILQFFKRRTCSKWVKAIQAEHTPKSEGTPNQSLFFNPKKLQNALNTLSPLEMILKERQETLESWYSNGVIQNGKFNEEIELVNGIEGIEFDKDTSAKDELFFHAVDGTQCDTRIGNATNSSQSATCYGDVAKDVPDFEDTAYTDGTLVGSAKDLWDTDAETITDTSSATSEEESKIMLPAGIKKTPSNGCLTLPVGCTETACDMLKSPGAKYCNNVDLSSHRTSKIYQLITCLKEVRDYKYTPGRSTYMEPLSKAEKIVSLICNIGNERLKFKEEEKKVIGPLMAVAIYFIQFDIVCTLKTFGSCWLHGTIPQKISALEFLVRDYSHFPFENTTLSTRFEEIKIHELIKRLENIKDDEWVLTLTDTSDYDSSD